MKNSRYENAPCLPDAERIDVASLFEARCGRVELEVGPGRGGFMYERLEAEPKACLLGLEVRRKWATLVDERLRARGLGARGRVFAEDARLALPRFETAVFDAVYVHFPDPWWKKRHQKRLVVGAPLIHEVARVLKPSGILFIQTDVAERADEYERLVGREPGFAACGDPRVEDHPFTARSPRERRAMQDGLPVYRLLYRLAPAES
jgi:tRNA (guanine-N7-)-methyltransferase